MKRCFECFKWLPEEEYKLIVVEGIWVRDNYCPDCYPTKTESPHYRKAPKPTLQDYEQMGYYIGFMGNTPYKEVCEYFKISYEGD